MYSIITYHHMILAIISRKLERMIDGKIAKKKEERVES
jgi:hypothetical protein